MSTPTNPENQNQQVAPTARVQAAVRRAVQHYDDRRVGGDSHTSAYNAAMDELESLTDGNDRAAADAAYMDGLPSLRAALGGLHATATPRDTVIARRLRAELSTTAPSAATIEDLQTELDSQRADATAQPGDRSAAEAAVERLSDYLRRDVPLAEAADYALRDAVLAASCERDILQASFAVEGYEHLYAQGVDGATARRDALAGAWELVPSTGNPSPGTDAAHRVLDGVTARLERFEQRHLQHEAETEGRGEGAEEFSVTTWSPTPEQLDRAVDRVPPLHSIEIRMPGQDPETVQMPGWDAADALDNTRVMYPEAGRTHLSQDTPAYLSTTLNHPQDTAELTPEPEAGTGVHLLTGPDGQPWIEVTQDYPAPPAPAAVTRTDGPVAAAEPPVVPVPSPSEVYLRAEAEASAAVAELDQRMLDGLGLAQATSEIMPAPGEQADTVSSGLRAQRWYLHYINVGYLPGDAAARAVRQEAERSEDYVAHEADRAQFYAEYAEPGATKPFPVVEQRVLITFPDGTTEAEIVSGRDREHTLANARAWITSDGYNHDAHVAYLGPADPPTIPVPTEATTPCDRDDCHGDRTPFGEAHANEDDATAVVSTQCLGCGIESAHYWDLPEVDYFAQFGHTVGEQVGSDDPEVLAPVTAEALAAAGFLSPGAELHYLGEATERGEADEAQEHAASTGAGAYARVVAADAVDAYVAGTRTPEGGSGPAWIGATTGRPGLGRLTATDAVAHYVERLAAGDGPEQARTAAIEHTATSLWYHPAPTQRPPYVATHAEIPSWVREYDTLAAAYTARFGLDMVDDPVPAELAGQVCEWFDRHAAGDPVQALEQEVGETYSRYAESSRFAQESSLTPEDRATEQAEADAAADSYTALEAQLTAAKAARDREVTPRELNSVRDLARDLHRAARGLDAEDPRVRHAEAAREAYNEVHSLYTATCGDDDPDPGPASPPWLGPEHHRAQTAADPDRRGDAFQVALDDDRERADARRATEQGHTENTREAEADAADQQGRTVDTTHSVLTATPERNAPYVGMSRGQMPSPELDTGAEELDEPEEPPDAPAPGAGPSPEPVDTGPDATAATPVLDEPAEPTPAGNTGQVPEQRPAGEAEPSGLDAALDRASAAVQAADAELARHAQLAHSAELGRQQHAETQAERAAEVAQAAPELEVSQ